MLAGKPPMRLREFRVLFVCLMTFVVTGCAGVALTAAGVGGGVAASHHVGGLAYRTFTAPIPKVRSAVLAALRKMDIKPDRTEKIGLGERVIAKAGDRIVEIELEALTSNTTRMRAVVTKEGGVLVDAATAIEIINQTEIAFGRG
ncbi:MAG: DUF3568 family protein [Rhodocyclaceae bacterium]|nr:DUF3568 family protein [Rhodocyclaceae bacterium]